MINSTIREFTASIPQYKEILQIRLETLKTFITEWNIPLTIPDVSALESFDPSMVMQLVSRVLLSFSNVVSNVFMLLLVVVFMLLESPVIKYKITLAFNGGKSNFNQEVEHLSRVVESIIRYLGVKTLMSALTGITIYVVLDIFSVQYGVLWAVLAFLLNYIPNIGSVLAGIPIVLQALLLNGFSDGIAVMIGVIAINMLVGNILGLSTLVVTLSLLFWGWLLGTVGMLLSVPLTMALKIALESSPNTIQYAVLLGDVPELEKGKYLMNK